jgi:thioredoxin 2
MSNTVIQCPTCTTRNRVANDAAGHPRCAKCHADLPWLADVGSDEFDQVVATSAVPTVVDLWAPWCGPCRTVAPALEQLAADLAGSVRVVKVNVDEAPAVSARLGVQGIPTMVLYEGGTEIARQVGAMPAHAIRQWVDSHTTPAKASS